MSAISIRWRRSPAYTFKDAYCFAQEKCDTVSGIKIIEGGNGPTIESIIDSIGNSNNPPADILDAL